MATRKRSASKIYELYVELDGIDPPVWRQIMVPSTITLHKLHDVLQVVMGWTNSHLHSFEIGERTFSSTDAELDELKMQDETGHTLEVLLGESIREFTYEYDFGDSWRHHIELGSIAKPNTDWLYPLCVAGARAAPPDDVGGVGGYEEFLAAIGNPDHEEHDRMLTWIGGAFDPEGIDLNAVNRVLRYPRP